MIRKTTNGQNKTLAENMNIFKIEPIFKSISV